MKVNPTMKEYLEAGLINNTHGIAGCILITSYCDSPDVLASIPVLYIKKGEEYVPFPIEHAAVHKGRVLAKPRDISDPETAAKYKNKTVYAHRDDIPKDEGAYFISDIIGLPVINAESGKKYGILKDVITNSANDVYEIETPTGTAYMPAVGEFVKNVDIENGIFILPIEGMFDEI